MIFSYLILPFTYKIKQEPDQILLFFYVPSFIFIRTPDLSKINDEQLSTYYSYCVKHFNCIFSISRNYEYGRE